MKKIILSSLIFLFLLSLITFKVYALQECSSVTCSGTTDTVHNWCTFIGTPYNSAYDCTVNPPYGYQQCYWSPAACDSNDCRDFINSDPSYCVGKVACPPNIPNSCVFPECNISTGQCYASCDSNAYCAATSTPTPTPAPSSCTGLHGSQSYIGCGVCHGYSQCTDYGDGCCVGSPGPTVPPTPTPGVPVGCGSFASFQCSSFIAKNTTTGQTATGVQKGAVIGPGSIVSMAPGQNILFSTQYPGYGQMSTNGCALTRTQFIVRNSSNQPINDCLEAGGDFVSNYCINLISHIAYSNTGSWPFGFTEAESPPGTVPTPTPNIPLQPILDTRPSFDQVLPDPKAPAVNRRYKGSCTVGPVQCCQETKNADGSFSCSDGGNSSCAEIINPTACNINDNGIVKNPKDSGNDRTANKIFNTAGSYKVEAHEAHVQGNNDGFPCMVQVDVGAAPPSTNITGSLDKAFCQDSSHPVSFIQGWASDTLNPSVQQTVTLRVGSTATSPIIASIVANQDPSITRPDLITGHACDGATGGAGHCLFTWNVPSGSFLNDGNPHTISAWVGLIQLPSSPLEYNPIPANIIPNRNNNCPAPVLGATISGTIYNDNTGTGVANGTYNGTAAISLYQDAALTNHIADATWNPASGTYSFSNIPFGFTYYLNVTNLSANRYSSTSLPIIVPVVGSSVSVQPIFISRYYQITGVVFNDLSKNGIRDAGEPIYPRGQVRLNGTVVNVAADGTYSYNLTNQLKPNVPYSLSYNDAAPLPGYIFEVSNQSATLLPPSCLPLAPGAVCDQISWPGVTTGDVTNLNFAVTNSVPWVQFQGLDVRTDAGFSSTVPATVDTSCRDTNTPDNAGYSSVSKY